MPRVSIITINYNNSNLVKDFLDSLIIYFPKEYDLELVIVDNASEVASYELLKSIIANSSLSVKLHRSNINLGFGGGNMLGNQFATGDYLAFINNDIVFTEDCFTSLIDFLKKNKDAGVVTSQQFNIEKKPTSGIDYFHGIRKELFGRSFLESFLPKDRLKRCDYPYLKSSQADFIQGCFMFFDKQKFNEVGGFDTNLFLYFEEMDICYRLLQKGYKTYMVPNASFLHLHGASTTKSDLIKQELLLSKLYIYRKNYSFLKFKILQIIISVKLFFKSIFSPKNFKLFFITVKGGHLKYSLKQKQQIRG